MPNTQRRFLWLGLGSLTLLIVVLALVSVWPALKEQWWLRQLQNGSEEERQLAAQSLSDVGSRRAVPILLEEFLAMHDSKSDVLRYPFGSSKVQDHWSLRALLEIGPSVSLLVETFQNESLPIDDRLLALYVTARIGQGAQEAIPALLGTHEHSNRRIRGMSLVALAAMGTEVDEAVPRLLARLEDEVRSFEDGGLAARRDSKGFKPSVVWALGRSEAREAVPLFVRYLNAAQIWRKQAQSKAELGDPSYSQLGGIVQSIIDSVGMVGPEAESAIPSILQFADDEESGVRTAVATALSRIAPDSVTTQTTLATLANDPNTHVRTAAKQGLQRTTQ